MLAVAVLFFLIPGDVRIIPDDKHSEIREMDKKDHTASVKDSVTSPRRRLDFDNVNVSGTVTDVDKQKEDEVVRGDDDNGGEDDTVYGDLSNVPGAI